MPIPPGRENDPVKCTMCGTDFGVVEDFADGETVECPNCPEVYEMDYPSEDEIESGVRRVGTVRATEVE